MRILVTGAGGRLGKAFQQLMRSGKVPPGLELVFANRETLNICSSRDVRSILAGLRPAAVINCAAYTDVDGAEDHQSEAWQVNVTGPEVLAMLAKPVGTKLVHVSSDFVFDGTRKSVPYLEDDPTDPLNHYGRSKLAGEFRVLLTSSDNLVVRTSWLFADTDPRPEPPRFQVDRIGSPTYAPDLAEAILRLLVAGVGGVVHFANSGVAGRRCALPGARAARPRFTVLDTSLYKKLTGQTPRPWEQTVMDCGRPTTREGGTENPAARVFPGRPDDPAPQTPGGTTP